MALIPMKDEEVTLVVKYENVTSHPGKVKRAILAYKAPGLSIYVKGNGEKLHYDRLNVIAMNMCLERHIPVISLRRAK